MENTETKYAVKSSQELTKYIRENKINNIAGTDLNGAYYINTVGKWTYSGNSNNFTFVPLKEYLEMINKDKYNYTLSKPGYLKAVNILFDAKSYKNISEETVLNRDSHSSRIEYLKEMGVLDIWFNKTEIKPALELPVIANHTGKVQGDYLVYGCQKVHISLFDTKNCNLDQATFLTNTVTNEDIKKIRTYLSENKYI